jgi:hypothetical protein
MTLHFRHVLLTAIVVFLATASPAVAGTFTVDRQTDDGTGPCIPTSCTLRQALVSAGADPAPDTIQIPVGDYQLTQGRLDVDSAVTIVGAGARVTTIHGAEGDSAFFVNLVAKATISHLTMTGGGTSSATILENQGEVVLDHVHVTGGSANQGAGVTNNGGTMTIEHSLLDANRAGYRGGAISNLGGSTPAKLVVTDSTITNNSAGDGPGGGILVMGNSANSTTLERVTLMRNSAFGGSGVYVDPDTGGTLHLRGSIIAENLDFDQLSNCGGAPPISDGGNVSDGADCGLTATGDQSGDPKVALQPDTTGETDVYPIAADSLARDRFACTGSDQRDLVRPQGTACDAGAYELDQAPDTTLAGGPSGFTFASTEPGTTFQCGLVSGSGPVAFTPCTSPHSVGTLPAGTYTFFVRAIDAAGNPDLSPASQTFTVAAPPPPPPTPTPTPAPAPVFHVTVVVAEASGTILVKKKGSSKFEPLNAAEGIPLGSTIDARKGVVVLTSVPKAGGKPEVAKFFDGIFKVTQAGDITTLTLTEPLAPCGKGARAAAKKPKTRKLWGEGKGKFRTKGQYSAATIRGTKWLVEDGCRFTRTRVTQGTVTVRDEVKKKSIVLRKGKSYTARPRH